MKVTFSAVYGETIDTWYFQSVVETLMAAPPPGYEWADASVGVRTGPNLASGRGHVLGNFVEHTNGDVLAMIDTDQTFSPQRFWDTVACYGTVKSQVPETGILAGITWMSPHPQLRRPIPNIYAENPKGGLLQMATYPPNSVVEVAAVGCSCMVIGREVAEHFVTENINPFHHLPLVHWRALARDLAAWDDIDKIEQTMKTAVSRADQMGEDLSFCARVREAGYKIFVHTGLTFGHSKPYLLEEDHYLAAVEEWRNQEPVAP